MSNLSNLLNTIYREEQYRITSNYGMRQYKTYEFHPGIDTQGSSLKANLYAFTSGTVTKVDDHECYQGHLCLGDKPGRGKYVVITLDNGYTVIYQHLSSINVTPGQKVNTDTIIGVEGTTGDSTGVHLHLEVRSASTREAVDPSYLADLIYVDSPTNDIESTDSNNTKVYENEIQYTSALNHKSINILNDTDELHEPIYPDYTVDPDINTNKYNKAGSINEILEKDKKVQDEIIEHEPYPVDPKIYQLENHSPMAYMTKPKRDYIHNIPLTDPRLAALIDETFRISLATEKRLVQLDNILSAQMRILHRIASRIHINCIYYGGQSIYKKYACIRCLHNDMVNESNVTLDQCLNCLRYEPIIGQVYEIQDEEAFNIPIDTAPVIDDIQTARLTKEDIITNSKIEKYNSKKLESKLEDQKPDSNKNIANIFNWQKTVINESTKQKPKIALYNYDGEPLRPTLIGSIDESQDSSSVIQDDNIQIPDVSDNINSSGLRQASDSLIAGLMMWEGYASDVYNKDGYDTIGYGHVIKDGEEDLYNGNISIEKAKELLRQDANDWTEYLNNKLASYKIQNLITQNQYDALLAFTLSTGRPELVLEDMANYILHPSESALTAVKQTLLSCIHATWNGQSHVHLKGLYRRRLVEYTMFADSNYNIIPTNSVPPDWYKHYNYENCPTKGLIGTNTGTTIIND